MRRPRVAVFVPALALFGVAVLGVGVEPGSAAADTSVAFAFQDPRIDESSGLATGVRHPDVVYTHNDSGDGPRLFAVGPDGKTIATFRVRGAKARDWEAMAAGPNDRGQASLYLADIGDNLGGAWPTISVYQVREPPALLDARLDSVRYTFRYADGARDAEALLVDPRNGRLYVASKEDRKGKKGPGLYAAPKRLRTDKVNVLRRIATVPEQVTDGAYAPDGRHFVLRTYFSAYLYDRPGHRVARFGLPSQIQGEGVTFTPDGGALLTSSEGFNSDVLRVSLPEKHRPTPSESPGQGVGAQTGGLTPLWLAAVVAVFLFMLARGRRR